MEDTDGTSFHMTPDEFRRVGHEAVEWVASYLERVGELPVAAAVEPGWVREQLPLHAPDAPESWDAILADLDRVVVPGTTHWQSPNFYAYFQGNSSGPAVIGELIVSGLGVQGMLWATGPVCTEIETHVLDWLAELLGLPERFRSTGTGGGVIQDGASGATLCALLAARHRSGDTASLSARRAYTSEHAHSSVEKAMRIAGLAVDQLRLAPGDETHALRVDVLHEMVRADVDAGLVPFFVCATVGTTSSHAIDPLRAIGEVCADAGAWFHVDAAHAGSAAVCPEFRWIHDGLELADSYCVDPHKWLFTNLECDAFYVADRAPLISALSVLPEYLRNASSESGAVIDYRDWHVPLGRRFRAMKLWFVLRHYGGEGLRHHVREHVAWTQELVARIDAHPRYERMAPVPLNLVCLRHVDGDEATRRVLDAVNATGRAYLSHSRLDDALAIRISVGQTNTRRHHVEALWDLLDSLA